MSIVSEISSPLVAFNALSAFDKRKTMRSLALRTMEENGYTPVKYPGRQAIWLCEKGGKAIVVALKSSLERSISFHPIVGSNGTRFDTLDDVEQVLHVTPNVNVYQGERAHWIEVRLLPAENLRQRMTKNYRARQQAGLSLADDGNISQWLVLDYPHPCGNGPYSEGCGIAGEFDSIALIPVS